MKHIFNMMGFRKRFKLETRAMPGQTAPAVPLPFELSHTITEGEDSVSLHFGTIFAPASPRDGLEIPLAHIPVYETSDGDLYLMGVESVLHIDYDDPKKTVFVTREGPAIRISREDVYRLGAGALYHEGARQTETGYRHRQFPANADRAAPVPVSDDPFDPFGPYGGDGTVMVIGGAPLERPSPENGGPDAPVEFSTSFSALYKDVDPGVLQYYGEPLVPPPAPAPRLRPQGRRTQLNVRVLAH